VSNEEREYVEMPAPLPRDGKIVTVEKSRKDELDRLLEETKEGERRDLRKKNDGYRRAEREKRRATDSDTEAERTQRSTERAEATLRKAEGYKAAWGAEITWGEQKYDLGTTAGWRDYNQAIREARSSLSEYKRQQYRRELAAISSRTPEPIIPRRSLVTQIGPPKTASQRDITRLRSAGYELPSDKAIYLSPGGEPFYYQQDPRSIGPPEQPKPPSNILYKTEAFFRKVFEKGYTAKRLLGEEAEVAKLAGRDLEAGAKFGASYGVLALTSIGEGATFPIRPYAWYGAASSIRQIVTSPEVRAQAVQSVKADPLALLVSVPSAYLGGLTTARIIQKLRGPRVTTTIKERYQPSRIAARGKYGGLPTKAQKVKFSKETATFLDSHSRETLGIVGEYPSGAYDKKLWGFTETGGDLLPIQIPEGMGETRTVYRLSVKKLFKPTRIPKIHSLGFGRVSPVKVVTKVTARTTPAAAGVLGLVPTVKTIQVQTPQQVLKSRQQVIQAQAQRQRQIQRSEQTPLQVSSQIQVQEQELKQKQLQKQIQKQTSIQTQIQRQIVPTPTTPALRPPPIPSLTPIPVTPVLPPRRIKKRRTRDPLLGLDVWGEPRTYAKSLEPVLSKKLKRLIGT